MIDGCWLPALDGDRRAVSLFERHYSCDLNGRKRRGSKLFVQPGEKMVLLTVECDALFVWVRNRVPRWDGQTGVNCAVFRNESPHLASELIREAADIAWQKWPGERLFTYVDAKRVRRKRDPGRCFVKAGWRKCGISQKNQLLIFECLPEWQRVAA